MEREELRNLQRKEAVSRIEEMTKVFHLNPHIKDYFEEGKVYYSYITALTMGCIDTIEYDERYARVLREFEEETGCLVYHAIESGDTLVLLYVGRRPDEWPMQRLEGDYIMAYVYNFASPDCSEFGSIRISGYMEGGNLVRIG